jgi:S-adenosylmethionine:tRNA ribosyltransferase-isomerase
MSALAVARGREAHEPPEARGEGRDDVALLVADRADGSLLPMRFRELGRILRPGDLLVVNISATLPAELPGALGERPVRLRLSTPVAGGAWMVELRADDGSPLHPPPVGSRLVLPAGGSAEVLAPFAGSERLVVARIDLAVPLELYLRRHGRAIRYGYVPAEWPLDAYQTVFAREPGSAEMPSAGRPFTPALVAELVSRGILIAPVTLHTGVSSPEVGEPPFPERYDVPEATARLVNAVHTWGARVIAVGTTVVRALETVSGPDGTVAAGRGSTGHLVTPASGVRAVDGLLTGWHEPRSSHLQLLEAVAGRDLVERSYREAVRRGYRRHEFGDLHLIVAERPRSAVEARAGSRR